MQIAFIGLGHMGSGMAANLARAGHAVRAFDLAAAAIDRSRRRRLHRRADRRRRRRRGRGGRHHAPGRPSRPGGLLRTRSSPAAAPGTLLIDASTIDVATAQAVAAAAADRGLAMVDAPVSGGTAAATAGTLTFMVGGSPDAFAAARLLLADMGKAVIHAGAAGMGQAAKLWQHHAARRPHGGHLRGVRPGSAPRPRPADLLRHQQQGVGAELGR